MMVSLVFIWLLGVLVFGFLAVMLWRNVPLLTGQRTLLMMGVVVVLGWPAAVVLTALACLCGLVEFMVGRHLWSALGSMVRPS